MDGLICNSPMKKALLILEIISFIISIAYLHEWWSYILIIIGIALLFIWKNTDKFISDFNRGYVDAMSDD